MFKYKLSYFFRKKTKIEKHLINEKAFKRLDKGGVATLLIVLGWLSTASLSLSILFSTPVAYNFIANLLSFVSISSETIDAFLHLSAIGMIFLFIFSLFLSMFLLFEQINPIHVFRYISTYTCKRYSKQSFSKDFKKLLPLLQKIGFSNQESTSFINEVTSNETYYYRESHKEKFFLRLKNFYIRDNYKDIQNNEDNIDISNTINNFYLQKETNKPSLVNVSPQEQEITFFAKEQMEK